MRFCAGLQMILMETCVQWAALTSVWKTSTIRVCYTLFKADNSYICLSLALYSCLICISQEEQTGSTEKKEKGEQNTHTHKKISVSPHFTFGSTADKNSV